MHARTYVRKYAWVMSDCKHSQQQTRNKGTALAGSMSTDPLGRAMPPLGKGFFRGRAALRRDSPPVGASTEAAGTASASGTARPVVKQEQQEEPPVAVKREIDATVQAPRLHL